jgi:hypothetical protein
MKTKAVLLVLAFLLGGLLLSACGGNRVLVGSGKMATQDRPVGSFSEVEITGIGKAIITQGSSTSLRVEADDNLISDVESKVEGNRLKLEFKRGLRITNANITYHITVQNLMVLETAGDGNVEADNLTVPNLQVKIGGLGDMRLGGKADNLDLQMGGAGNLKAEKLELTTAKVVISGAGSADLTVNGKLDVSLRGAGSVTYGGEPQLTQDIRGIGSVKKR